MTEVLVVGAGPVGLALAADLRARGVAVDVVERRVDPGAGTRAIGIHSPALELLEASGATDGIRERAVRIARGEARADGRVLAEIRFDRCGPGIRTWRPCRSPTRSRCSRARPTGGGGEWA